MAGLHGNGRKHLKVPAIIAKSGRVCHKFVKKFYEDQVCYEIRTSLSQHKHW